MLTGKCWLCKASQNGSPPSLFGSSSELDFSPPNPSKSILLLSPPVFNLQISIRPLRSSLIWNGQPASYGHDHWPRCHLMLQICLFSLKLHALESQMGQVLPPPHFLMSSLSISRSRRLQIASTFPSPSLHLSLWLFYDFRGVSFLLD